MFTDNELISNPYPTANYNCSTGLPFDIFIAEYTIYKTEHSTQNSPAYFRIIADGYDIGNDATLKLKINITKVPENIINNICENLPENNFTLLNIMNNKPVLHFIRLDTSADLTLVNSDATFRVFIDREYSGTSGNQGTGVAGNFKVKINSFDPTEGYLLESLLPGSGILITHDGDKATVSFDTSIILGTDGKIKSELLPTIISSTTWGSIGGTLANQTDLITALGTKQNSLPSGSASQFLRGSDKTFVQIAYSDLTGLPTIPSGITNWGTIQGTISSQTDLVTALNLKANQSTTYTKTEIDATFGNYTNTANSDLKYQPLDSDLTSISVLTNNGLLRKVGGVWGMDNATYLTTGDLGGYLPLSFSTAQVLQYPSGNSRFTFSSIGRFITKDLQFNHEMALEPQNLALRFNDTAFDHLLKSNGLTDARIWQLPNASGTLALTSQIPSIPNGSNANQYLNWNGTIWTNKQIAYSEISGTPVTGVSSVFGRTGSVLAQSNDYTFAQIGSKPITLAGYGITDALPSSYVPSWVSISGKPSTLVGYGITDAQPLDSDLTTIAALSTNGILRKTAGVWGMDANAYALTSDLSGYLPLTFTTAQILNIPSGSGRIGSSFSFEDGGNFIVKSITPNRFFTINANNETIVYSGSSLSFQALTANQTWQLPNASGTLALTSQIPSVDNYIAKDGTTPTTASIPFAQGLSSDRGLRIAGGLYGPSSPQIFLGDDTSVYIFRTPNNSFYIQNSDLYNPFSIYNSNVATDSSVASFGFSNTGIEVMQGGSVVPSYIKYKLSNPLGSIDGHIFEGAGISITAPFADGSAIKIPDSSWIRPQTAGGSIYLTNGSNPAVFNSVLHLTSGSTTLTNGDGVAQFGKISIGAYGVNIVHNEDDSSNSSVSLSNNYATLYSGNNSNVVVSSNSATMYGGDSNLTLNNDYASLYQAGSGFYIDSTGIKPQGISPGTVTTNGFVGLNSSGYLVKSPALTTTTAGVLTRVYLNPTDVVVDGTTYNTLTSDGAGTVNETQSVSSNNTLQTFAVGFISDGYLTDGVISAGGYTANMWVNTNNCNHEVDYYIYEYLTDALGANPLLLGILESGGLVLSDSNDHIIQLTTSIPADVPYVAGQRIKFVVKAIANTTGGGAHTLSIKYGLTHQSFIDVPVAITTDMVTDTRNGDILTASLDNLIAKDGTTPTTAVIPFAQGLSSDKGLSVALDAQIGGALTVVGNTKTAGYLLTKQSNTPVATSYSWVLSSGNALEINLTTSSGTTTITTSAPSDSTYSTLSVIGHGTATRDLIITQSGVTFYMTGKTTGASITLDTIPIDGKAFYHFYWVSTTKCFINRVYVA